MKNDSQVRIKQIARRIKKGHYILLPYARKLMKVRGRSVWKVFGNPDETRSASLCNGISKEPNLLTIKTKTQRARKYSVFVFVFFCFVIGCS